MRCAVGSWLETLSFMTWLAAFVNSSLIYMFKPRSVSQTAAVVQKLAHAVNSTLPIQGPINNTFHSTPIFQAAAASSHTFASIRSTLFTALLIGLASEHVYLLALYVTRHVLREILWNHSPEEVALRKGNYLLKRQYLDAMHLEKPETQTSTIAERDPQEEFWTNQNGEDLGLAEIQRLQKAE
jgi:anoctamin-10